MALLGLTAAATGGCAVVPQAGLPRDSRASTPVSAVPRGLLPGQRTAADLHLALAHAHATRDAWGATAPQAALLRWAVEVAAEQAAAVSLPASVPPTPSASGTPTPGSVPSPVPELTTQLTLAVESYRAATLDPTLADPLKWAALAAWASALALQVAAPAAPLEPAAVRRRPAGQSALEAARDAVAAAEQAAFALQVAAGTPGLEEAEVARLRQRIASWLGLRDDLRGLADTVGASPSPGPAWYGVGAPEGPDAARALVAGAQSAALPVLGRSLAHGPDALRPRLVDALVETATDVPAWGGMMRRWPGWPV